MKKFFLSAMFLWFFFLVATPCWLVAESGEEENAVTSVMSDQKGLAVTIYNADLGLVKDRRAVTLPQGVVRLKFMDVAAGIIPESVSIRSLPASDSLAILEQNYEYDLLNPEKLLDKYVGKEIKLYVKNPYTEREEIQSATLLSNNGGPIFKIGEDITFGHPGRVLFPKVPENLMAQPTLLWLLENKSAGPRQVETSYLTNNINWRADYVAVLNEKDDRLDLSGWVTIDNRSGAMYPNAQLKLVAGDIHRVREEVLAARRAPVALSAPAADQFREGGFFEYHIYTLQRPASIKDNQKKQIRLLAAADIPVQKEYLLRGASHYYHGLHASPLPPEKVRVVAQIYNSEANHLGLPLPKGIVRVYKNDQDQSLQFVGEDAVDHTAKDEKIRIELGNAFDVIVERMQTSWKKLAQDTQETAFEIVFRNHKKEDIVVKVVEPIPGDWEITEKNHPFTKGKSLTADFEIPVPEGREVKLTYRVRMRF